MSPGLKKAVYSASWETHLRATGRHLPHGITVLHKWTRPALTPARQAGTRFTCPRGMEGWVDLGSLIVAQQGIESRNAWLQVRHLTLHHQDTWWVWHTGAGQMYFAQNYMGSSQSVTRDGGWSEMVNLRGVDRTPFPTWNKQQPFI